MEGRLRNKAPQAKIEMYECAAVGGILKTIPWTKSQCKGDANVGILNS